jgi:hypothetical protein
MGWALGLILIYAGFANMFWDGTNSLTIPSLLVGIFFLTISSAGCKKWGAKDMFCLISIIVGLAMVAYAFHELWWPGESLNCIVFYYFIGGLILAIVGGITNIQTQSVGEITTIYNDTINKINEDKSISEEKKSKTRRFLSFFKEKHIYYIPLAVEFIKRYLWST